MFEQFLSHPSVHVNEISLLWFPVVFIFLSVHFAAAHDTVKVPTLVSVNPLVSLMSLGTLNLASSPWRQPSLMLLSAFVFRITRS